MSQTHPFHILCHVNEQNIIDNYCRLIAQHIVLDSNFVLQISNTFSLPTSVASNIQNESDPVEYLINQIIATAPANSYIIIPPNTEVTNVPYVGGTFDASTNTFSQAPQTPAPANPSWVIDATIIDGSN